MAERAVNILRGRNEVLNITPQNLVEFWAVVTRPLNSNGLGLTSVQAVSEMNAVKRFFALLPEAPLHQAWERIVSKYQVYGKSTHDARLVVAMEVNSIASLLTFNVEDFVRYSGITVIDPRVLA